MPAIADLSFDSPFLLAPMAGVTDSAFRSLCRRMGAAGTYTEMISAKALLFGDKKTAALLEIHPEERPCGVQIFGSEPEICAQGAQIALELSHADFLDINMGCPAPKIVNNGEGSALMQDLPRAAKIIAAVRQAIDVPLTVKFRKGYEAEDDNCAEFGRMAESCGADALCVHGRTRRQMYGGQSGGERPRDCQRRYIRAGTGPGGPARRSRFRRRRPGRSGKPLPFSAAAGRLAGGAASRAARFGWGYRRYGRAADADVPAQGGGSSHARGPQTYSVVSQGHTGRKAL